MSKPSTILAGAAGDAREYGRAGLYGLLTPQGNPTAEPEMRILLPPQSSMLCARLTSRAGDLRSRLTDYLARLSTFIDQFDAITFDAIGFACTGSSYSLEAEEERIQLARIETRKGYPVVTAAGAVEQALMALAIRAIALVSPYPSWLTDACRAHWERRGVRVTATLQLPPASPAQPIYAHTTPALVERVERFDTHGAEAVLLTGTGMPSLRVLQPLEVARGVPVLSSNLCLAWALAKITGTAHPGPESRLYGGWSSRLAIS
jgi:maleate isomerase